MYFIITDAQQDYNQSLKQVDVDKDETDRKLNLAQSLLKETVTKLKKQVRLDF